MRVLVVEDDKDTTFLYRLYLAKAGHEVFPAASGFEALALAEAEPPDAALLDLHFPGGDGISLLRKLRSRPETATAAIGIVTADVGLGSRLRAWRAGTDLYVHKPFDFDALIRSLEHAAAETIASRLMRRRDELERLTAGWLEENPGQDAAVWMDSEMKDEVRSRPVLSLVVGDHPRTDEARPDDKHER